MAGVAGARTATVGHFADKRRGGDARSSRQSFEKLTSVIRLVRAELHLMEAAPAAGRRFAFSWDEIRRSWSAGAGFKGPQEDDEVVSRFSLTRPASGPSYWSSPAASTASDRFLNSRLPTHWPSLNVYTSNRRSSYWIPLPRPRAE